MNTTILALIPKKEDASEMRDYRPISLCNVLYKVISKILANRLKKILPGFILPNQSAFVEDRLLMENVLLASELVKDYHKEMISPRCAMKIDISKAFDSVQWEFLTNMLTAINIPEQFIHWLKLCYTTATFSVQVNGELAGFFRSKRGLRQGCSLSPYLFVICMNALSRMIDEAARDRQIGYHPRCKNINLTHLCFADDLIVFSDGKKKSMEGVLGAFDKFAAASGLCISLPKSTLFLTGVSETTKAEILQDFPFELGTLPMRYLGLPLLTKRMTATDYEPLLELIRGRISTWTARFLSYAGRLQLLRSVIYSITNFWIGAFRLPNACIREIEKLCASFLWSGPELNNKKAKVAWNLVCMPKKEGGLGLLSLKQANVVSCLKLLWRILSRKPSLWVQWVRVNLLKQSTIWLVNDHPSNGSWMWRKLVKYRDKAIQLYRVEVNNGRTTLFWFDSWSSLGRLYDMVGVRGCIDMGLPLQATVAEAMFTRRRRRHRTEIYLKIEDELDALHLRGLTSSEDKFLWKSFEGKYQQTFSTRSTYEALRTPQSELNGYKCLWFSFATPKYSILSWLAMLNRLTTGDRMSSWNLGISTICVLCQSPLETRDHLFFECSYSREIWSGLVKEIMGIKFSANWADLITILSGSEFVSSKRLILRYAFQATIHRIWRERNDRRHGENPSPSQVLWRQLDKTIRNRLSLIRSSSRKHEDCLRVWFNYR